MIYVPDSTCGTERYPAGAPPSHVGREAPRGRPQAVGPEGRRAASDPATSPRAPPVTRDASRAAWAPLAAHRRRVLRRPAGARASVTRWSSGPPVLGTKGSRSSPRRSGRRARALARASGPRHPDREGRESGPQAARARVGDRYHARALRTPREVRNALVYVLQNWRKHVPGARGVDARSSGRWFEGWRTPVERIPASPPVVPPRTWLAAVGWRKLGLLHVDEGPAVTRRAR